MSNKEYNFDISLDFFSLPAFLIAFAKLIFLILLKTVLFLVCLRAFLALLIIGIFQIIPDSLFKKQGFIFILSVNGKNWEILEEQ